MRLRLAFMGSPGFSVPALAALLDAGHDVACVYAQPPRPAGRGQKLRPTAVHAFAESRGLPVRTPKGLKRAEAQADFAALNLDLAVVAAYGLILPKAILSAPRLGCLNLHASLLPRWRGAAPIQRAIMAGDAVTGVQAMLMEEGLDTGPILMSRETPIEADDTAGTLHDRLSLLAAAIAPLAVAGWAAGRLQPQPQDSAGVLYAAKIMPEEAEIDWTAPARLVDRHIRGLSPAPGAWFLCPTDRSPVRMKALMSRLAGGEGAPGEVLDEGLKVACGEGAVRLLRVQREGRQAMDAGPFLQGSPVPAGTRLHIRGETA